jgi:hypothetical protein
MGIRGLRLQELLCLSMFINLPVLGLMILGTWRMTLVQHPQAVWKEAGTYLVRLGGCETCSPGEQFVSQ